MGAYKNDQATMSNLKPQDKIDYLLKEVKKLRLEIIELKEKINTKKIKSITPNDTFLI